MTEGRDPAPHVLRNALLPVVTFAGIQVGRLVGGAVLTETVFGWPGIGRLIFEALLQRDYNLLLGVFLVSSAMVVVFNFVADLVYRSSIRASSRLMRQFWRMLLRNPGGVSALVILLIAICVALRRAAAVPASPWLMVQAVPAAVHEADSRSAPTCSAAT